MQIHRTCHSSRPPSTTAHADEAVKVDILRRVWIAGGDATSVECGRVIEIHQHDLVARGLDDSTPPTATAWRMPNAERPCSVPRGLQRTRGVRVLSVLSEESLFIQES